MKTRSFLGTVLLSLFVMPARAASVNLVVNPDFARVYAARRLTAETLPQRRGEHRWLPAYPDDVEPFLPYGWSVAGRDGHRPLLALAQVDGRAALRVRTGSDERLTVRQQYLEIVPGHPYALGLEVRGRGRVRLDAQVETPAPRETLARLEQDAEAEWTPIEAEVEAGPHRRLLALSIEVGPDADVYLRGVRLETRTEEGWMAPEDHLTRPVRPGPETLFLENFEGDEIHFSPCGQGELSRAGEGRFGRGFVVSPTEGGPVAHLKFGALPEKGTLSFWFRPQRLPERPRPSYYPLALYTRTPGLQETRVFFSITPWQGVNRFGFHKARYAHDSAQTAPGSAGWGRWQEGTWHHFAGSWDGEVVRLYVDGVLEGVLYGAEKVLPHGEAVHLVLSSPGIVDEIHIAEGLLFGPVPPENAPVGSYLPPARVGGAEDLSADPTPDLTPEQRERLRSENIAPRPEAGADYLFPAGAIQPAWEGLKGLRLREDYFGEGADAMEVALPGRQAGANFGAAVYWPLPDIEPGDYYLGVWLDAGGSGSGGLHLNPSVYRNGFRFDLGAARDPVQVRPGRWLTEVQTAECIFLEPGDEIAFVPRGDRQHLYQLALYREAPARGHGVTGRTFGAPDGAPLRLRLLLIPEIRGEPSDGAELEAVITAANPLPYAVRAEVDWTLADHFGAPVAQRTETLTLAPHRQDVIRHAFRAHGEARAYQLSVRSRPAPGFRFPAERPRDMVDLFAGVRAELTPNLPDPLTTWNHTRLNLASEVPRPGTVIPVPGPHNWTYGDHAFADTETFWFTTRQNGIVIANFIGDRAAASSALQFNHGPGMAWTKTAVEAYRDMGMTGVKGIYWQSFYNLPVQAVSFTMPEMELRYYGGARFDRRITLFDDEFRPGRLEFFWTLRDPEGVAVRQGRVAAEPGVPCSSTGRGRNMWTG